MESRKQEPETSGKLTFTRVEDFVAAYANNIQLQPSVWDLKLVFGELDQSSGRADVVEQHTSVTLSWPEAKLLHYYLALALLGHELEDGKIYLPKRVLPPEMLEVPEDLANNPTAVSLREAAVKLREQLLAGL
jgi:hypothetical protein